MFIRGLNFALVASLALGCTPSSHAALNQTQDIQQAPSSSTARMLGTVKAISDKTLTLSTDSGTEVTVAVPAGARIMLTAPGQKDLTGATSVPLNQVQAGDRVLVRGQASNDGKSVTAASLVVMRRSDIAAAQENVRQDWQKRGVGGLVTAVDTAARTITVSNLVAAGQRNIVIRLSKDTVIRRYAPDSMKFDDAKPGDLSEIKPGDQLRARGVRNAEGTELAAEELVSGSFRNIAGTVNSADSGKNTLSVTDLATKKPLTVQVASDSQLRQLPPMVAQRLAMRLRAGSQSPAPAAGANAAAGGPPRQGMSRPGEPPNGGERGGPRPGPAGDFQQMLSRMPEVAIGTLHKGDAVMIVATQGSANSQPTVITLLTGVEPILTAAPDGGGAAMLLSPWNLGSGMADAMGQ